MGDFSFVILFCKGFDCVMDNFNVRLVSIVLVKVKHPLDYVALFHPELLEAIWMGLVGVKYNNYR